MTDEIFDYRQSMQDQAKAAHRTTISPPRMQTEAENHAKDGQCQVIALPNLPSVAGRVKYAMGVMNANQFSQRCGISASYLNQLCTGKAKTLSAYNANRIAGASSMNVTVGWLLGLQQKAAPEPSAPPKQEAQELPDLPDFWARLEWSIDRAGESLSKIAEKSGMSKSTLSYTLSKKATIKEKSRKPLANALNVPEEWLCAGLKSDAEFEKEKVDKMNASKKAKKEKMQEKVVQTTQSKTIPPFGTHLHFEGVYSGDVLSALVSVLKGTYRVNLTIDEVEGTT